MSNTSQPHYSHLPIALHQVMVVVIAAVYAAILLRENFPKGTDIREGFKTWHFMLELTVLSLAVFRLLVRPFSRKPPITPEPPAWQRLLDNAAHAALYARLLDMRIAGWIILSTSGKPIPFFWFELPPLLGPDKALAGIVKEGHEPSGIALHFAVGFHAPATLFHHYIAKDDTMQRILPRRAG